MSELLNELTTVAEVTEVANEDGPPPGNATASLDAGCATTPPPEEPQQDSAGVTVDEEIEPVGGQPHPEPALGSEEGGGGSDDPPENGSSSTALDSCLPSTEAIKATGAGQGLGTPKLVLKVKPQIVISGTQLAPLSSEAIQAMQRRNKPQNFFLRSGELVGVQSDEKGRPKIYTLDAHSLRHELSLSADFYKTTLKGLVGVHPPMGVVNNILGRPSLPFSALDCIIEVPTLRPDLTLLSKPGFDAETGIFLVADPNVHVPKLSDDPSGEEIERALSLLNDALGEFPYADEASRANAMALVLTPVIRAAITGCVPLALIEAPQAGTGKGLLAKCIARIATGRDAEMTTVPNNEEELRKKITAMLRRGSGLVIFDNVEGKLNSPTLAAVLTAETWSDRELGSSTQLNLPNRATWIATGNNIRLGGDLPRRCFQIRLDAKLSMPWLHRKFRHENLIDWIRENRWELVWAALTLARAWAAAGAPKPTTPSLGSYEPWCHVIGGILEHAGIDNFLGNLSDTYDVADEDTGEWEAFLAGLHLVFKGLPFTTAEFSAALGEDSHLAVALPEDLQRLWSEPTERASFGKCLGKALASRVGRRFGQSGVHIERGAKKQNAQLWKIVLAEPIKPPGVPMLSFIPAEPERCC
jgi:hypothetical protein